MSLGDYMEEMSQNQLDQQVEDHMKGLVEEQAGKDKELEKKETAIALRDTNEEPEVSKEDAEEDSQEGSEEESDSEDESQASSNDDNSSSDSEDEEGETAETKGRKEEEEEEENDKEEDADELDDLDGDSMSAGEIEQMLEDSIGETNAPNNAAEKKEELAKAVVQHQQQTQAPQAPQASKGGEPAAAVAAANSNLAHFNV